MAVRDNAVSVAQLLDSGRLTGYQQWRVALVALTIVFDGIDNQLLGIVIPTLMAEWHVPRRAFAPVVSLGYLGMMVGGLVAGLIGDRIGRRAALLGSMILFGVLTVAGAFVNSPEMMGVLRFLAGIGLGGAMPNAATLAAEYVPARRRPLAVTMTIVCVPLGATLAGLLGIQVLPLIGWRNCSLPEGSCRLSLRSCCGSSCRNRRTFSRDTSAGGRSSPASWKRWDTLPHVAPSSSIHHA